MSSHTYLAVDTPRFTAHPLSLLTSNPLSLHRLKKHALSLSIPLACGLGVNLYAPSAFAVETETAHTQEHTLATITVVATPQDSYKPKPSASTLRSKAVALDTAQVVNVVPKQVIADQRPRNLDDSLTNVSGITQGNTLASTQDTVMKRGFGGNRDGSIMVNGMPIVQGRSMTAAVDSVEVLKGPASMLYGLMDPGGVVNVVSKQPLQQPQTLLSLYGSSYAGGRNGTGASIDTTNAIGHTGFAYRLVADYINEDYWRNFGTHRETLIAPSLSWADEQTQVQFNYQYRQYLTPFDRGTILDPRTQRPLAISKTERLDEPFNSMDGETHLAQLSIDHQFNETWKAHVAGSYNRETYDAYQLRNNAINTKTGVLTRSNDATLGALSTDTYGIAYLDGKLNLAGLQHDLQLGMDAEYRKIYRRDLLRQKVNSNFSYLNPIYGQESPSLTISASDSAQTDALHNQALFLQDAIHLGNDWIVQTGVRYQRYQQIAGRGRPFQTNTDTADAKWLPSLGVIYKLNDSMSLYANYSESLKPSSTIAPLASGTVITSALAPETARAYEVGYKVDLSNRFNATVAVFDIQKKNVLVSQFNDTTKLTDWRTSGAARSRGIEIDASGRVSQRWNLIASYAYLDAKTTEDPDYAGNDLWNVARQTASLSAVFNAGLVGDGNLRLGAGTRYVGRRAGDSANSFYLPNYTVADAFATYDTRIGGQKVKFQLNLKNIFDKTYYTSSVNAYGISMGDARQVQVQTTFSF